MLRPRFLCYKEASDLVPQAREYQMPSLSDWKVPASAQPKPEDYGYDLERAFNAVVGLRAIIPGDAYTAETLGMMADRKSTRLNSSHEVPSRMPSSA